jgi:DNA-binding CsgD family transcriptional regulator
MVIDVRLVDRDAEKQYLGHLLDDVRAGTGRALVLRGEPGIGKSALLEHTILRAQDMQVLRVSAVESEKHLGYSALHQLLMPVLASQDALPQPQRQALGVAFGLEAGPPGDPFLIGLAALTLLSEAAQGRPVLCVVDDAQWVDDESSDVIAFVARRLLADPVGVLLGVRGTTHLDPRFAGLPDRVVRGLPDHAACELIDESTSQPIDPAVANRLVTETGGNPLAVLEAARGLTPSQRTGAAPLPEPLPVGPRLEESFVRRVRDLPPETQSLLLLMAASSPGQDEVLWRATADLGVADGASGAAEAAGLVTCRPGMRFVHPLVRSAVYHAAPADQRRRAHRALAAASELDLVTRAWHLSEGAARPDEEVAADVEAAAGLVRRRGGYPATALLLERAAQLTPDVRRRAERELAAAQVHVLAGGVDRADGLLERATPVLADPRSSAEARRMRGTIDATRGRVADAADALVGAARVLWPLDPGDAADTLISALDSTVFAGWAPSAPILEQIAGLVSDLRSTEVGSATPSQLLLQGYAARVTSGYAAGVASTRAAIDALRRGDDESDVVFERLELGVVSAADLLDEAAVEQLVTIWIDKARRRGALARLARGLAFRGVFVETPSGRLAAARTSYAEADDLGELTHNPAVVPPTGAHRLITLALSGHEQQTRETAAAVAGEAPGRRAAGEAAFAAHSLGLLEISLGNYGAAVACLIPAFVDGTPLVGTMALPDLVEAAARADQPDLAKAALGRLTDRATAAATPLAAGLLARSRALLAASDQAEDEFAEALQHLDGSRSTPQLARTHLLYGEWLRRRRLRGRAREQLHRALELFESMGLDAFAERCRAELRTTGERVRRRVVGDAEELTPREVQIAALVSAGEGNRQIAAQLFVTPSTVEYHLRNVFRKLGVTSRTQLAHLMSAAEPAAGERATVPGHT